MLKQDARNGLNATEPFRHKLLAERSKDPELQRTFIPLLENELVDGSRTSVYLKRLADLYKEEARIRHLEAKAALQKAASASDEVNLDGQDLIDCDTLRRRRMIYDAIRDRKRASDIGTGRAGAQYASVVYETKIP